MAADGAEAARVVQRDVVGTEAAHRDAADRDPPWVQVEAADHGGDDLAGHVAAPAPGRAVVPVAVFAAVRKGDDGRPPAERLERAEEGFVFDEGGVGAAVAVEEDEQRPAARPVDVGGRDDDLDALVVTDVAAVDGQVDDLGAVAVGGGEDGEGEDGVDRAEHHQGDRRQGDRAPTSHLADGRSSSVRYLRGHGVQ